MIESGSEVSLILKPLGIADLVPLVLLVHLDLGQPSPSTLVRSYDVVLEPSLVLSVAVYYLFLGASSLDSSSDLQVSSSPPELS